MYLPLKLILDLLFSNRHSLRNTSKKTFVKLSPSTSNNQAMINLQIFSFTTLIEWKFPFFSFNCQIFSKKPKYVKPNTAQNLRCSLKNGKYSLLKTENHEPLFAKMPRTLCLSKLKRYFFLLWKYSRRVTKISAQYYL